MKMPDAELSFLGIEKMTTNTYAWVLTGGLHRGVAKLVGQALRKTDRDERNRVPCIGVASWSYTRNRQALVTGSNFRTVRYKKFEHFALDATSQSLDSNHTHFILVDDGTEGKQYGETDLLSRLKRLVGQETSGGQLFACCNSASSSW